MCSSSPFYFTIICKQSTFLASIALSPAAAVRHLRDVCSVLRVLNTVCRLVAVGWSRAKYLIFTPVAAVAATGGPTNKQYAVQNRNQWLQQNSQDSAQNPGGKGRKSNPCK